MSWIRDLAEVAVHGEEARTRVSEVRSRKSGDSARALRGLRIVADSAFRRILPLPLLVPVLLVAPMGCDVFAGVDPAAGASTGGGEGIDPDASSVLEDAGSSATDATTGEDSAVVTASR